MGTYEGLTINDLLTFGCFRSRQSLMSNHNHQSDLIPYCLNSDLYKVGPKLWALETQVTKTGDKFETVRGVLSCRRCCLFTRHPSLPLSLLFSFLVPPVSSSCAGSRSTSMHASVCMRGPDRLHTTPTSTAWTTRLQQLLSFALCFFFGSTGSKFGKRVILFLITWSKHQ